MDPGSSDALDNALYEACNRADVTQVRLLVDQGAHINKIIGPPGRLDYSINIGAKTGCLPLVRFLLDHGATINAGAVREAAFRGDLQMLQLLLEPIKAHLAKHGMSRKWRIDLASILVGTVKRGHSETVEALKVFRARVDEFDKALDTGLITASAAGDIHSVKYFIGMGAASKTDALFAAAEYNQFETLQYFLESFQFEPEELSGPLTLSAGHGHMPSILLLVDHGAQDDGAALSKAAKFCNNNITDYLLENFRYTSHEMSHALTVAARTGHTVMIDRLIKEGAQGSGALETAVRKGLVAATELLLQKFSYSSTELSKALHMAMFLWLRPRQSPRASFSERTTSSHEVWERPREQITRMLLGQGAQTCENYYCRLVEMMVLVNNPFGIELLEQRVKYSLMEALPDQYLISLAMFNQREAIVEALLDTPLSPTASSTEPAKASSTHPLAGTTTPWEGISNDHSNTTRPVNGAATTWEGSFYHPTPTPLISAVKAQNERWCRLLIKRGAVQVNDWCSYKPSNRPLSYYGFEDKTSTPKDEQFDELGYAFGKEAFQDCALSMAIRSGDLSIVRLLIENGADPWMNRQGVSMFELAGKQKMLKDVLSFLEQSAADFNINRQEWVGGRSILHWAAAHGDADLVETLCKKGAKLDMSDSMHKVPLHVAVKAGNIDTVKALLWAGATTSRRDVEDCLCPGELAGKLAHEAPESDPLRAQRLAIKPYLDEWMINNMDHLDAVNVRKEAQAVGAKNFNAAGPFLWEGELVDHFSDENSVHWSDEEDQG